jgi:hypothetical protein
MCFQLITRIFSGINPFLARDRRSEAGGQPKNQKLFAAAASS